MLFRRRAPRLQQMLSKTIFFWGNCEDSESICFPLNFSPCILDSQMLYFLAVPPAGLAQPIKVIKAMSAADVEVTPGRASEEAVSVSRTAASVDTPHTVDAEKALQSLQATRVARAGDNVIIYENHNKMNAMLLRPGGSYTNQYGKFLHEDMIGLPFGSKIYPRGRGNGYLLLLRATPGKLEHPPFVHLAPRSILLVKLSTLSILTDLCSHLMLARSTSIASPACSPTLYCCGSRRVVDVLACTAHADSVPHRYQHDPARPQHIARFRRRREWYGQRLAQYFHLARRGAPWAPVHVRIQQREGDQGWFTTPVVIPTSSLLFFFSIRLFLIACSDLPAHPLD